MSAVEKVLPYYTYEDYKHWKDRWELIDGIPYSMSPAPVPVNQSIAAKLSTEFVNELKACDHCTVYQPIDYLIGKGTVLQPDLLISCSKIEKPYLDFAPMLVCEILSPSTALKDRHTKFGIFQEEKIPYYIIVAPKLQEVEIYQLGDDEYVLKQRGRDIRFGFRIDSCKASINFSAIW
ncbi:MAG: Uma2 family endonuclease [Chitinophagaceae bacterium]|nr:Uma2 family endonuclease [Chitinophagaceae bacterium]